jgi:hypothetical protein
MRQAARKEPTPMFAQNQMSHTEHYLLSVCGSKWTEKFLAMYTIYIDDSGTAPEQKVAIAAGIIIPAARLRAFESEWKRFLEKEGLVPDGFHTSECIAKNPKSAFAGWDDVRVERVFARVQQITFKYVTKAFVIAIHKQNYDEVVPEEMWSGIGRSHFIWAVSSLLGLGHDWATGHSVPMEYIFDSTDDKELKRDVTEAIAYSEEVGYGKHFIDHHAFRSRKQTPALQLADFYAWHSFQMAGYKFFKHAIPPMALKTVEAFAARSSSSPKNGTWAVAQTLNRQALEAWVKKVRSSAEVSKVRAYKQEKKAARMPKKRGSKESGG